MIIDLRQPAAFIVDDSEEMDGSRRARRRRKRAASVFMPGVGIGRAVKKRRQRRRARRASANASGPFTTRQLLLGDDSTEEMSGLGGYEKASLALSAVGIAVAAYGTFYMTRNQRKSA